MAPRKTGPSKKKLFTPAQANATLPLVGRIVQDIADLAHQLRTTHERLVGLKQGDDEGLSLAQREALQSQLEAEFNRSRERMREFETELHQIGVVLKDYFAGLIDFPCLMDGREIYLCWKLGEQEVAHWHETDAGFSGRQRLMVEVEAR